MPLEQVTVVQNRGHQALVGYDSSKDLAVVALRGTLSFQDVIADVQNYHMDDYVLCDGCQVGTGWLEACEALLIGITEALASIVAQRPTVRIVITGHSLGAAMAPLLLGELLTASEPTLYSAVKWPVYTFGQPRVGNAAYAQWASEKFQIYRAVHHDDPVPHVPPPALGFSHISTEVWYAEEGTGPGSYMICDASGEDQECSAGTLLSAETTDHCRYLDHDICQCEPSGF